MPRRGGNKVKPAKEAVGEEDPISGEEENALWLARRQQWIHTITEHYEPHFWIPGYPDSIGILCKPEKSSPHNILYSAKSERSFLGILQVSRLKISRLT